MRVKTAPLRVDTIPPVTVVHQGEEKTQELESKIKEMQEIQQNQETRVIHICNAILYLYQHWECFYAFKKACACATFADISDQSATSAYENICAFFSQEDKGIKISEEDVEGCIKAAKILNEQGCY